MTLPTSLLQLAAIACFIVGAWLYYGIRRLLHARGYPVSVFVYSGPCWDYYRDLMEQADAPERKRLKTRKTIMTIAFTLAGALLLFASLISYTAHPQ